MLETITDKTTFIRVLRPFSLIVAVATCGLGISLALVEGSENIFLAWLVTSTGVLLQVAVNLINDYRDINSRKFTTAQRQVISRNTRLGWTVMLFATLLGLYMVSIRGWPLLGIIGVFSAWGYTRGQINYKERGLGILLVFLLMGVLLIGGSYYVVSGAYHWNVFWLSLPFSLLSSLLLLSNELRVYEEDPAAGIKTLSIRLGYELGIKLYYWLVALLYLVSVLLYKAGLLHGMILLLVTIFALWQPLKLLKLPQRQRTHLTPLTGRFCREAGKTPGYFFVDLAGGVGDIAKALIKGWRKILILDPCEEMMAVAEHRLGSQGHYIDAVAENIPLQDKSVDVLTISFGIRNTADIKKSLEEIARVLEPDGHSYCLEFSTPHAWLRPFYNAWSKTVIPRLGAFVAGHPDAYTYLIESIREFPVQEEVADMIRATGLENVSYSNLSFGIACIHRARKPM